jgi:PIN domain nuclease of toxin-antitoxin system
MNYLLDTHTLIWTILDANQISPKTRGIIQNTQNNIHVSVVSFWEFSIKYSLGKLTSSGISPEDLLPLAQKNQFSILPLKPEEVSTAYRMPWISTHKDPFDRILIWQALQTNMTIISKDSDFSLYLHLGLKLTW